MEKKKPEIKYSDPVEEIIGNPPGRILRWGTFIIFIFAGYGSRREPAISAAAYPQYSQQKAMIFGSNTLSFILVRFLPCYTIHLS